MAGSCLVAARAASAVEAWSTGVRRGLSRGPVLALLRPRPPATEAARASAIPPSARTVRGAPALPPLCVEAGEQPPDAYAEYYQQVSDGMTQVSKKKRPLAQHGGRSPFSGSGGAAARAVGRGAARARPAVPAQQGALLAALRPGR